MKQIIRIKYNGPIDNELDERLAGLLEFPPLNFEWLAQGYNLETKTRDISFGRERLDEKKQYKTNGQRRISGLEVNRGIIGSGA